MKVTLLLFTRACNSNHSVFIFRYSTTFIRELSRNPQFLRQNDLLDQQRTLSVSDDKRQLSLGGRVIRFIGWLGGFYSRKAVLTRSANSIYEQCVDEVDYESFFEVCQMPDSFQSWYLVAHLHIWLCMARLKREDEDGKFIIRQLVSFFWKDVEGRLTQLGIQSGFVVSNGLKELDKEFRGLILAYEEGLLTDDRRLAAAIWRNLISDKSSTNVQSISRIVDYIRSQVKEMDSTESDILRKTGKMNKLPLTLNRV